MLELVYKDLHAAFWFLLAAAPIYVLQLITLEDVPAAALVVTLIFSTAFAFGSILVEETQGTEVTWASLPVGRERIVGARYLTSALGLALGLIPTWAISGSILGPGALALVFFLLQVSIALFLPCYFRYGAGKGLAVSAVVWLGLVVALAVASAAIAAATGTEFTPDEQRIAEMAAWFETVEHLFAAALVILALLLTAGSVALSTRWYAARDV